MIEAKVARLERAQVEDVIAALLRTLSDQQIAALTVRLEAGADPATILKEIAG